MNKTRAFTLVELIVVITILAILGTIAFISFQGYSRDARNSTRISDIKTTETALELYSLQTGKYPVPDNNTEVLTNSGTKLWYKGDFNDNMLQTVGKLSQLPTDPETGKTMGYATTLQRKEYELKYNLELSHNTPNTITQTNAEETLPYVKGTFNGVFVVGEDSTYYMTPGLFSDETDVTSTGSNFDLHERQITHQVEPITNGSGAAITTDILEANKEAFGSGTKSIVENNLDLRGGIYDTILNLEETQYSDFAAAITSGDAVALESITTNNSENSTSSYSIGESVLLNGTNQYFSTGSLGLSGNEITLSFWVKRNELGTAQGLFSGSQSGAYEWRSKLTFTANDTLYFGDYRNDYGWFNQWETSMKFRDTSSWYHIVVVNTEIGDDLRLYVNGIEVDFPELNHEGTYHYSSYFSGMIGAWPNSYIGYDIVNNNYSGDYLSNIQVLGSQALSPTDFGTKNNTTGKWLPKIYTGTYEPSDYYLNFSSGSLLGKDASGNSNDWTVNGGITQVSDSPTNNYATLNPLELDAATYSKGNLQMNTSSLALWASTRGTLKIPTTGKWYFEGEVGPWNTGNAAILSYGIATSEASLEAGTTGNAWVNYRRIGSSASYGIYEHTTDTSSTKLFNGDAFSTNDRMNIAYDADTGNFWIGRNGDYYDNSGGKTGDPSTGANPTMVIPVEKRNDLFPFFAIHSSNPGNAQTTAIFNENDWSDTPTDFKALSTSNFSQVNDKIENHFETLLYTGNGGTQTITGTNWGGDDQLVWIKSRNNTQEHQVYDSIRGDGKLLQTNGSYFESSNLGISSANNGFNVEKVSGFDGINTSGSNYVAWRFRAGQSRASFTGSIAATVSANQDLGFSIVKYTGNDTAGQSVEHGLGTEPKMIIIKALDNLNGSQNWQVWHKDLDAGKFLQLNQTGGGYDESGGIHNRFEAPYGDNQVFYIGGNDAVNGAGSEFIAYIFTDSDFIDIGSYIGNNSSNGTFVNTGGTPQYFLSKNSDVSSNWYIHDSIRNNFNVVKNTLLPNEPNLEVTNVTELDFTSMGLKNRSTAQSMNKEYTYIYMTLKEPLGVGVSQ